ncbi:hypothetical protein HC891_26330, partial [Candidatus Gracilibacteria bacterium]|nr:hypothetical protein [Candidatus Gracilibacteria bacterium]
QKGETALIIGPAGYRYGLLQLGRLAGLKMYGVASGSKRAVVEEYGATPIDYRSQDFVEVVRRAEPGGIEIGPDALAVLTPAAATQIYTMPTGAAEQHIQLRTAPGAQLHWQTAPQILFSGATYRQYTQITLAPGARVLLSEILVAGRLAHGESWQCCALHESQRDTRSRRACRGWRPYPYRAAAPKPRLQRRNGRISGARHTLAVGGHLRRRVYRSADQRRRATDQRRNLAC